MEKIPLKGYPQLVLLGNKNFRTITKTNFYFSQGSLELPKASSSILEKNKQGLLMSNHRYDDTFGPERLQILRYESRFPMLGDLL